VERIERVGGQVLAQRRVSDLTLDSTGQVSAVVCEDEVFQADAVIFAVGVSGMQKIVLGSPTLRDRQAFRNLANLRAVDVLATRL